MSSFVKNSLIGLGLIVLLFLGYVLFVQQGPEDVLNASGSQQTSEAAAQTELFFNRLQALRGLHLTEKGGVFSDPRFLSLIDFRLRLVPEPTGRQNPFAPLP
ncbi:hypothetical protein KC727_00400 [Candidatus Kaiserbacteria bacterium]|nr:hypothetical protein [Candidatus Kaiserbacteria bacterium]